LADDHPIVREPLRDWLQEHEPDFEVVAESGDGLETIRLTQQLQPDIVLLDVDMPGADGVQVAAAIRAAQLSTRIVVLTGYADGRHARALARVGVEGYLLKTTTFPQIVAVLRLVHAGHTCVPTTLTGLAPTPDAAAHRDRPTTRELEVLQVLAQGLRTRVIAEALCLTERTVRFHLASLFEKLGAESRTQAVAVARQRGWLA
jgi:DNA-binding NarL/FixJ family response regulator